MKRLKPIVIAVLVLLAFSGCVTTQIISSWTAPGVTVKEGDFKKVLVLALVENESSRRIIEDKLVSLLKVPSVASYSYLTKEDLLNTVDVAKEKLRKDDYDAIISIRLAKIEKDINYVPGTYPNYFYSPWTYGAYAAPFYYDPGYYSVDDVYNVETNLYTLKPEKLIWSGVTSTINPEKIDKAVDEIAKVVKDKMVEEGFFLEPVKNKK